MGEHSKQVRVENWGTYFLQRLQSFFNKTDYCDLTLQFNGNVQLKVHRLVLNACTEYFQVLEQTCEIIDGNIIIMPQDLQSDVVLPIINFMYTGMLELQAGSYDKLYSTAELMNITVLTKLLNAQKVPPSPAHRPQNKKSTTPITWNLQGKRIAARTIDPDLPEPLPGRKLPIWKRKSVPFTTDTTTSRITKIIPADVVSSPKLFLSSDNSPRPSRFELPDEEDESTTFDSASFDEISYASKPLAVPAHKSNDKRKIDSFEEIKRTAKSTRQSTSSQSSKSPRPIDLDAVKDFLREQKLRSELIDYDDSEAADNDFDSYGENTTTIKVKSPQASPAKRVRFSLDEKENSGAAQKISIAPGSVGGTESDVNHTKIITEVLKKYPHLVKKNKNIRLKILAKSVSPKVSSPMKVTTSTSKVNLTVTKQDQGKPKIRIGNTEQLSRKVEEGPWICQLCSTAGEPPTEFVLYYLFRKHMTEVHNEKVDSRMCKFCGHKSNKHNMLMYHQYVAHGVNPPPMYNFPKCNQCNYIAVTQALLVKHKMTHKNLSIECTECKISFTTQDALNGHMQMTGHAEDSSKVDFDCQYCSKKCQSEGNLFSHIKMYHKDEALRDGVASLEDDDDDGSMYESLPTKEKINILSNLKVCDMKTTDYVQTDEQPSASLEPSSEAEALSNVASGIATSLGLVDTIVVLDDSQFTLRTEDPDNQTDFILPDLMHDQTEDAYIHNLQTTEQTVVTTANHQQVGKELMSNNSISSTDELVMVLTDQEYGDGTNNEMLNIDDSNIVVLYSHPVDGQDTQYITQQGNLILNPDTGMIEMTGNFNQSSTDSNGKVCLTSKQQGGDMNILQQQQQQQQQDKANEICEESIEMIQQEINKNMEQDLQQKQHVDQVDGNLNQSGEDSGTVAESIVEEKCLDEPMEVDEECSASLIENVVNSEPQPPPVEGNDLIEEAASTEEQPASPLPVLQEEKDLSQPEVVPEPTEEIEQPPLPAETEDEQQLQPESIPPPPPDEDEPMEVDSAKPSTDEVDTGKADEITEPDGHDDVVEDDAKNNHPATEEQTLPADVADVQLDENSLSQDNNSENTLDESFEGSAVESASQELSEGIKGPKISKIILDDWDDTDNSQQSERAINTAIVSTSSTNSSEKPTVSINTLMNDWEDDEDDDGSNKIEKV